MTTTKKKNDQSLLSRLKTAVQRLKILLSSTVLSCSWHISVSIRRSSLSRHQLSFNDRPGLMLCSDEAESAGSGSGSSRRLQRTISFPSEDDDIDIDRRAEIFIAKFRRQLQMERQISLQLRYRRGNSFESISP